ncbi:spore germination protein [Jeotgalibacillus sp. R-1-5s-1]|uniref:spore germination protein n=1 Tax=Jeotgalibacillus sp. R-1-5s-1 TaxID=2555897 RepID=UPI00106972F7|nr:spore germination protein [Jeotgalibacillus sp. R-1-5s-1]TFE03286.1 spore germination protein [Jeotgalibacillus sp. R-1-5s-1]
MNEKSGKSFRKMQYIRECQSLDELIEQLSFHMGNTQDLVTVKVQFADKESVIIYLESTTDTNQLEKTFEWLTNVYWASDEPTETLRIAQVERGQTLDDTAKKILLGDTYLFSMEQGSWITYKIGSPLVLQRAIQEPKNEQIVRGAHAGFNENIITNLYQVRSRLKSPHLVIRYFTIGELSQTKCALLYLDHVANPMIIEEITMRLQSINTDVSFSIGTIEEYIEDDNFSPFPQLLNTERPDRVVGNLAEGRFALLLDGSPTSLIAPVNFFAFYQSPDDYNGRFMVGTFYRLLRIASFLIALLLPAIYIAIISFHFEIIPQDITLPTKRAIEDIPYPPLFEALLLELTIELIREAGIRLPNPIGQTIGIVGGLVIGDAVVNAGFISNIMIIVVALTAISSFVVPSVEMNTTVRILRFPFMILASLFGFFGVAIGLIILTIHLIRLESMCTPYLSPFAPFHLTAVKDMFLRFPAWNQTQRPADAMPINKKRHGKNRWWKHERKK